MDTTHLRYFVAVARTGSLTAAAAELKVTQPTLSVAVQRLESRLGTTLFHRRRDGMALTATGRELLHHAADALALLGHAEERVRAVENAAAPRVVLGCAATLCSSFLPSVLVEYGETLAGVEVELLAGAAPEIVKAVVARRVDFGVVGRPPPQAELEIVELYRDRHELYVAPRLAPAEAARLPVLFVDGAEARALLAALGERLPGRRSVCGSLSQVREQTAEGEGVGILPRHYAARAELPRVVPAGGDLPVVDETIALVQRAGRQPACAVARVQQALVAHGKRLAAW
jgi:DNA-binding transcriptional LysR family regulator